MSSTGEGALHDVRRALEEPLDLVELFRVLYRAAELALDTTGFYLAVGGLARPEDAGDGRARPGRAAAARGERGRADAERLAKGLDTIIGSSARLVEMLDLLLDVSKIEGGGLDLRPEPGDLVPLLREVVDGVSALSDRHRLSLAAPDTLTGVWDLGRLRQVLQNLLGNAIKYSPDGGTVAVRLAVVPGSAQLSVSDEGVGLAPEDLPHVSDRFYRAEGTRRLEGSGLGLYICQAIVTAHGGHIAARSEGLGKGSTFEVVLPVAVTGQQECRSSQ